MKRSQLQRKAALSRTTWLRSRPKPINRTDPARMAWKTSQAGMCECGCSRFSMHLERHHIVYEQHVRIEAPEQVYNLANSMLLSQNCHRAHHSGQRRILIESIPEPAIKFIADLMGDERGALYILRYYRNETR